jgi:hypothetical protein
MNNCNLIPFQAGNGLIDQSEIDDDFDGIYETIYTYKNGNVQLYESDIKKNGKWSLAIYFNYGLSGMGTALVITGSINEKYQGIR